MMPQTTLASAAHGGADYAELAQLGIRPDQLLDFSVNINPAPVPEALRALLAAVDITTYPDTDSRRVREAAAEACSVTPDHVLAGNGSSELIWLIGLAYLQPGDTVVLRQPSFGEYERAARIFKSEVRRYSEPLPAQPAKLGFICNPNNPTGDLVPASAILDLADRQPETTWILDEAYADFAIGRPTVIGLDMPANLIVLRSLTKFAALAGLRLGMAVAQPSIIQRLSAVKPPWNVNALAQAAGEYALRHPELLPDLDVLAASKRELMQGLRQLGLSPQSSACNFFLVEVGDACGIRRQLLRQRCLVRDCASFGLPEFIRIAVRSPGENRQLLAALANVL